MSSLKPLALVDVVSVGSSDSDSDGSADLLSVLASVSEEDCSVEVSSDELSTSVDGEASVVSGAGAGAGSSEVPHATRVAAKKTSAVSCMMRGLRDLVTVSCSSYCSF